MRSSDLRKIRDVLAGRSQGCILTADCRPLLAALPDDAPIAIVSDPPWGIQFVQHQASTGRPASNAVDHWIRRNAGIRVAGDDCPFEPAPLLRWPVILVGAGRFASRVPPGGTWMTWDKAPAKAPADTFSDSEFLWCSRPYVKRNVIRVLWKGICCCDRTRESGRRRHPMQKPILLMERMILALCPAAPVAGARPAAGLGRPLASPSGAADWDRVVVDPYCGVGSTLLAAMGLGRRYVGIDIDARWTRIARLRVRGLTGRDIDARLHNSAMQTG